MNRNTMEGIIEAIVMFGLMALVFGLMIYLEGTLW
jgi:hypothetical protein